MSPYHRPVMIS